MRDDVTPEDQLAALAGWLDDQATPVTATEVRTWGAESDERTVSADEPLAPITPIDGKKRDWKQWASDHPIALVGAAAAVTLLVALTAVALVGGDEDQSVDAVDQPTTGYSLVGITAEGQLAELDADGNVARIVNESLVPTGTGLPLNTDFEIGHPVLADGTTHEVGYYLAPRGTKVGSCDAPVPIATNVDAVWLEGSDDDPSNAAFLPRVEAFAVSPDGQSMAYITYDDEDVCRADGRALEVIELASREVAYRLDLGDQAGGNAPGGQSISWLDDEHIALAITPISAADEAGDGVSTETASMYIVDTTVTEELADLDPVALPAPLVFSASTSGRVIGFSRAGEGGFEPLPIGRVPAVTDGDPTVVSVDPSTGDLAVPGYVDQYTWLGIEDGPAVDIMGVDLVTLSLAVAPDGMVFVTVADLTGLDLSYMSSIVVDPTKVRTFRITRDGVTHRMAAGIVAVAVRPAGDSSTPTPTELPPTPTDPQADLVEIPEIVGLQADVARARLEANGLVVRTVTDAHPVVAVGEVFQQTPPAMTEVAIGTEVTITVSTGPGSAPDSVKEPAPDNDPSDDWLTDVAYVTSDGSVVVDRADAEPRTIADLDDDRMFTSVAYPWGPQLAASPDGRTLYVGTLPLSDFECDAEIYAIDVGSGEIEPVARGHSPAVSPDGTKLAYVVPSGVGVPAEANDCSFRIEVLDIESGEIKGWTDPWTTGSEEAKTFAMPNTLVWGSDNTTIGFQRTILGDVPNTGGFEPAYAGDEIFTFSTADAAGGAPLEAVPFVSEFPLGGRWTLVGGMSLAGEDQLLLRGYCRGEPGCDDETRVTRMPLDGSLQSETAVVEIGGLVVGGDEGLLQYAICEVPAAYCTGDSSRLMAIPIGQVDDVTPVEIASDVVATSWLP